MHLLLLDVVRFSAVFHRVLLGGRPVCAQLEFALPAGLEVVQELTLRPVSFFERYLGTLETELVRAIIVLDLLVGFGILNVVQQVQRTRRYAIRRACFYHNY